MRRPLAPLALVLAALLLAPRAAVAAPSAEVVGRAEAGMARSVGWLLARQAADGAWYSETYGAF